MKSLLLHCYGFFLSSEIKKQNQSTSGTLWFQFGAPIFNSWTNFPMCKKKNHFSPAYSIFAPILGACETAQCQSVCNLLSPSPLYFLYFQFGWRPERVLLRGSSWPRETYCGPKVDVVLPLPLSADERASVLTAARASPPEMTRSPGPTDDNERCNTLEHNNTTQRPPRGLSHYILQHFQTRANYLASSQPVGDGWCFFF
jgi:hypothetical protein